MFLNDGGTEPKTDSRSFKFLSREKGIENPPDVFRGNPDAMICNRYANSLRTCAVPNPVVRSSDSDFSSGK
jgi:hypothetical protein